MSERKELVKLFTAIYNEKQKHSTIFGTHGSSMTAWTMDRTMEDRTKVLDSSTESNLAENVFMEQGMLIDFEVLEDIIRNAKNFIK